MGKIVKLKKEITANGVTVPVDTNGEILESSLNSSPLSNPDGVLRVRFENPSDVVVNIEMNMIDQYIEDLPASAVVTP